MYRYDQIDVYFVGYMIRFNFYREFSILDALRMKQLLLTFLLLLVSCVWCGWVSTTCLWRLYLAFYEWYTHVYRMSMPDAFWVTLTFMSNIVRLQYHFANSDVRIYLKFSKTVKGVNLSIFNPDSQQMIHKIKRHFPSFTPSSHFPVGVPDCDRHVMRCPWSYKPLRHSCRRDQRACCKIPLIYREMCLCKIWNWVSWHHSRYNCGKGTCWSRDHLKMCLLLENGISVPTLFY